MKISLVMPETYLSSIHKKNQLIRIRNGRHRVNGKPKNTKMKQMPHWQKYLPIYLRYTRAGVWAPTSPGEAKASGTAQHW